MSPPRWWPWSATAAIVLLAVLALLLAWAQKSPCLHSYYDKSGALTLDWSNGRPYRDFCYSDTIPLYTAERLDQPGSFPYKTAWIDSPHTPYQQVRHMEYPVLTGIFMWVAAKGAQGYASLASSEGLPVRMAVIVFFDLVALALSVAWLINVWGVSRLVGRRAWDALLVAVSPLVIVHAFTNFDAIAVAFATGGILAWSRRRSLLAGVLLGLGGAAKFYPLLLLVPVLLLCWRAGKLREGGKATAAAAVAWLVVNAPIALLYPNGWREFFRLNTFRGSDPDSLYNVVAHFTGWGGFDGAVLPGQAPNVLNAVSAILFVGCCLAIAYVAMTAPRRPRLPQLCLLVIAAFLLSNKVWSPQYSLWLVPLAVLALPRWRALLAWMLLDALMWVPRMLFYLGVGHGGWPEGDFLAAVVIRDVAVLALCGLVLRDVYRPARDLIRVGGADDPCGGVLDGARDQVAFAPRVIMDFR